MRLCLLVAFAGCAMAQSLGTPASIARGDKLFAQGCSVGYCHGAGGSAARSQRLRGRSFDREYLVKVIRNGIPNTAMPAWGDRLTDGDINDLTDYIQSLATAPVAVAGGPSTEAQVALPPVKEEVLDRLAAAKGRIRLRGWAGLVAGTLLGLAGTLAVWRRGRRSIPRVTRC